jgi:hypothetical protein
MTAVESILLNAQSRWLRQQLKVLLLAVSLLLGACAATDARKEHDPIFFGTAGGANGGGGATGGVSFSW